MRTVMRTVLMAALLASSCLLRAQEYEYPFQNPAMPEEARLENAVSLMTVDEKIATIVGQGVPRLGIANPGSTEAIHGIVRGGSNQLPNMGNAGQFAAMQQAPRPQQQQGNRAQQQARQQAAPVMPQPVRLVFHGLLHRLLLPHMQLLAVLSTDLPPACVQVLEHDHVCSVLPGELNDCARTLFRNLFIQPPGISPESCYAFGTVHPLVLPHPVQHMIQTVFFSREADELPCSDSSV